MGDYTTQIELEGFNLGGAMLVFYLIYMLVMLAISVGSYVLQSLGLYTIAKRRGIKKPWLSWLPVGDMWILGCISDQFQYVVKGKVKNKRKAMLILNILMWITIILLYVLLGVMLVQLLSYDDSALQMDHAAMFHMMGSAVGMLGASLILSGLSIAIMVIRYIALYDAFYSCDPGNAVAFLLISIFVSVAQPILLFVCRNKDLGMPPRKQAPVYIPEQPVEPWENPEE